MVENIKWDDTSQINAPEEIKWDEPQEETPNIGGLESFGRGAAQAFGLGYSPQLIAAAKTGHMPGSSDPEYLAELAKQKAATDAAWAQHPYLYGTGMVASAIPAAAGAVLGAPEEAVGAGLLAGSSSLAGLGGAGLRAAAGEGAGLIPTALKGAASVAENPVVQGAIYGSSEGENLSDKLSGAAAGAIGAKVAPAVIGAAGKGIGALAGKIADPVVHALTGGPNTAAFAGDLAHDIGVSLPSAAAGQAPPVAGAAKLDFFNQIPKASARTLSELGGKISDIASDADPEKAGEAIRSAVNNWVWDAENPSGFKAQLNSFYEPLSLSNSSKRMDINNIRNAVDMARISDIGAVSDIEPTLKIVSKALDSENGFTFNQIHALRQIIDDQRSYNSLPGSAGLNDTILGQLRDAATKDMNSYAQMVGGTKAVQNLADANAKAQQLYDLRDNIFKVVGNPNANGPGAKQSSSIYSNIISSASAKKPNIAYLAPLENVVNNYDPEAWSMLSKTYANSLAPKGQFSFENFNKFYNDALHPKGKDLLFGPAGQNETRNILDKINLLGQVTADGTPLGQKLDSLASKAGSNISSIAFPETLAALGESAFLGGLPVRTLGAAGIGSAAGAYGARNIAKPLSKNQPPIGVQIAREAVQKATPALGAQVTAPNLGPAVKGATIYGGAKTINALPPEFWGAAGVLGQKFMGEASGGRIGRKTGGIVKKNPKAEAERLIKLADKLKKDEGSKTEPLLNLDDTTVAKALEIANRGI